MLPSTNQVSVITEKDHSRSSKFSINYVSFGARLLAFSTDILIFLTFLNPFLFPSSAWLVKSLLLVDSPVDKVLEMLSWDAGMLSGGSCYCRLVPAGCSRVGGAHRLDLGSGRTSCRIEVDG